MRYILYHAHCNDGFGAAYAAWLKFGYQDTTYISVTYQQPPPEMPDATEVFIVDFSYPRDILLELRERIPRVAIIDHHTTAEKALDGLDDCVFDMTKSGAVLAWEYFHPKTPIPDLFLYIQDRDLWTKELPQTEEVFYALVSYPYDFELWQSFNLDKLKIEGEAIYRKLKLDTDFLASESREIEFFGYKVRAVNTPVLQSDVGHALVKKYPEIPFAVCYHHTKDGFTKFSLRTEEDRRVNVSTIAKMFGGGGHSCAAGFMIKTADTTIESLLRNKGATTTQQMCQTLNELIQIDYEAAYDVLQRGTVCATVLLDHPDIIVREIADETELTGLGLINSLLARTNQQRIAAVYDDDKIIGFQPYTG